MKWSAYRPPCTAPRARPTKCLSGHKTANRTHKVSVRQLQGQRQNAKQVPAIPAPPRGQNRLTRGPKLPCPGRSDGERLHENSENRIFCMDRLEHWCRWGAISPL